MLPSLSPSQPMQSSRPVAMPSAKENTQRSGVTMHPDLREPFSNFLKAKLLDGNMMKPKYSLEEQARFDSNLHWFKSIKETLASMFDRGDKDKHALVFFPASQKVESMIMLTSSQEFAPIIQETVDSSSLEELAALIKTMDAISTGKPLPQNDYRNRNKELGLAISELDNVLPPPPKTMS